MKFTRWFGPDEKPGREGVYETSTGGVLVFTYWNRVWFWQATTMGIAHSYYKTGFNCGLAKQNKKWRGLTTKDGK